MKPEPLIVDIDDDFFEFQIGGKLMVMRFRKEVEDWIKDSLTDLVEYDSGSFRPMCDFTGSIDPSNRNGASFSSFPLYTTFRKHSVKFYNPEDYTLFRLRWL